ncbi:MAG: helix-hairpin-helix domain-containing protein [Desulfobaccales bacterium]
MRLRTFRWEQTGILVLLAGALLGLYLYREYPPSRPLPPVSSSVFVEIVGEGVPRPGVYAFGQAPALNEALGRAGAAAPAEGENRPLPSGSRVQVDGTGRLQVGRMEGARLLTLGLPVELNTASAADLERLPGLGPELARRIVAYREQHGPFRRLEDLTAVKGIGPQKLARLTMYLTVDPTPAAAIHPPDRQQGGRRKAGRPL